jgi:hypothetical protein
MKSEESCYGSCRVVTSDFGGCYSGPLEAISALKQCQRWRGINYMRGSYKLTSTLYLAAHRAATIQCEYAHISVTEVPIA